MTLEYPTSDMVFAQKSQKYRDW